MTARSPATSTSPGPNGERYLKFGYSPGDYILAPAPTTANASLNAPPGVAPAAPVDGDVWTTTAGIFAQINGVTYQLLMVPASGDVTINGNLHVTGTIQQDTGTD